MRLVPLLAAALLGAGCAQDSLVLAPAPKSGEAGTFAFHTAGSLARSADGRRLVPGEPDAISGELRLPEGRGPFSAVVLAHGCNGNRNVERACSPRTRTSTRNASR